jgi:hypothetical protein
LRKYLYAALDVAALDDLSEADPAIGWHDL